MPGLNAAIARKQKREPDYKSLFNSEIESVTRFWDECKADNLENNLKKLGVSSELISQICENIKLNDLVKSEQIFGPSKQQFFDNILLSECKQNFQEMVVAYFWAKIMQIEIRQNGAKVQFTEQFLKDTLRKTRFYLSVVGGYGCFNDDWYQGAKRQLIKWWIFGEYVANLEKMAPDIFKEKRLKGLYDEEDLYLGGIDNVMDEDPFVIIGILSDESFRERVAKKRFGNKLFAKVASECGVLGMERIRNEYS